MRGQKRQREKKKGGGRERIRPSQVDATKPGARRSVEDRSEI